MNPFASGTRLQQTVRLAIDCHTGELVPAEALFALQEDEFTTLRREAMQARMDRRKGRQADRFHCAICRTPLYLSRRIAGNQNRWFAHDGRADECPWFEGNRLAPDQIKALVYRGQQEGREHRELKDFIARWLSRDPQVQDVSLEKTTFSEVVKGQWRRPDVKCLYRGLPLVFEIQLSYTFLSDVIARDAFYRRENIFVIWVFASFDSSRAAVVDEAFFNRRNLFVLDGKARQDTASASALTFSGYRQVPILTDRQRWRDDWQARPVGLHEVSFPLDTYRPYFYDYAARRGELERQAAVDAHRAMQTQLWSSGIDAYRDAALRYFASDHGNSERQEMLGIVDELQENAAWHPGHQGLREAQFYGYHGVLAVLMSIRLGRPISYNPKLSVFQVLEAGLRSGSRVGKHAYAVLYLWAYKTYRPRVTEKQRHWLANYAHEVKCSLDSGAAVYRRDTSLDDAVELLFPELAQRLAGPFGTELASHAEDQ